MENNHQYRHYQGAENYQWPQEYSDMQQNGAMSWPVDPAASQNYANGDHYHMSQGGMSYNEADSFAFNIDSVSANAHSQYYNQPNSVKQVPNSVKQYPNSVNQFPNSVKQFPNSVKQVQAEDEKLPDITSKILEINKNNEANRSKKEIKDAKEQDSIAKMKSELKSEWNSTKILSSQNKLDENNIRSLLGIEDKSSAAAKEDTEKKTEHYNHLFMHWKPIGYMESPYMHKNGTPRQGCLVKESKGVIRILDALFNNPHHSLQGLEEYSHVWLVFVFDQNEGPYTKAKVSPPRLGGRRLGVFATRSPHRPNNIGLTLAKLEKVDRSSVHVSGVDILFGTPILDIKPYIPQYDAPQETPLLSREHFMQEVMSSTPHAAKTLPHLTDQCCDGSFVGEEEMECSTSTDPFRGITKEKVKVNESDYKHLFEKASQLENLTKSQRLTTSQQLENITSISAEENILGIEKTKSGVKTPDWLESSHKNIKVIFNPIAEKQLTEFSSNASQRCYRLQHCSSPSSLRSLIVSGLRSDPRSSYRRDKCPDLLHHFSADIATVRCLFMEDDTVEVLRILPKEA